MAGAVRIVWKYSQDKITLGEKLGEGGFGVLHKGVLKGTVVAVKILKSIIPNFNTPDEVEEASKEIQMLAALRHPNIVSLLGIAGDWTTNKVPWMIFEYLPDGDLSNYVLKKSPSEAQLLKFCYDICEGMKFLHLKGVCHRDLKSQNVLLNSTKNVAKVSDLGLSTFKHSDPLKPYCVKSFRFEKSCAAQIHYAKECFMDGIFSSASDVWSFGVIMCEIFNNGRHPYFGMDYQAISRHVITGQTPLSLVKLKASDDIITVVAGILKPIRHQRPSFQSLSKTFNELRKGQLNINGGKAVGAGVNAPGKQDNLAVILKLLAAAAQERAVDHDIKQRAAAKPAQLVMPPVQRQNAAQPIENKIPPPPVRKNAAAEQAKKRVVTFAAEPIKAKQPVQGQVAVQPVQRKIVALPVQRQIVAQPAQRNILVQLGQGQMVVMAVRREIVAQPLQRQILVQRQIVAQPAKRQVAVQPVQQINVAKPVQGHVIAMRVQRRQVIVQPVQRQPARNGQVLLIRNVQGQMLIKKRGPE